MIEWLLKQIKYHEPGTRLPTDKELAEKFKISPSTVIRRLRPLILKNIITRIPGKGTFIPSSQPGSAPVFPVSSARQVADILFDAVQSGEYKTGDILPSLKEIQYRFKVTYKTAIDAYRHLQETGMVTKAGKAFWVGTVRTLTRPARGKQVYLFNYRSPDFTELYRTDVLGPAYQRMEKEFTRQGFLVRYNSTDDLPGLAEIWSQTKKYPDGLIFCNFTEGQFRDLRPVLQRVLERVAPWTPPVLFEWERGHFKKELPNIQLFARGNIVSTASRSLTDYLHRHAFGRAAMFMHEGGYTWGFPASSLVTTRVYWELKRLAPEFDMRFTVIPYSFTGEHLQWLKNKKLPLQYLVHGQEVFRSLKEPDVLPLARQTPLVREFSEQYEAFRSFPIWIFDRAEDAAEAYAWAGENGVRVPDDLSILTLQDDPKYFHLGLTYCGPDWDTIGYQMAHAIIRDYPVARTSKGFLKTKAVVIEKLTTR